MAATSEVEICSNALLLIGDNPIASFTENSTRASLCANLWGSVRDNVLRSHPWNCAMRREVLAPDAVPPAFDWSYAFTLPGECLRVWSVGRVGEDPDWEVENGKLLMNEAVAYVRFIERVTDAAKYDAMLRMSLTSGMAAVLAYPITKSKTQQEAMVRLHEFHLQQARTADGQEGTGEFSTDSALIRVRG